MSCIMFVEFVEYFWFVKLFFGTFLIVWIEVASFAKSFLLFFAYRFSDFMVSIIEFKVRVPFLTLFS